jgi:hypothetical protein
VIQANIELILIRGLVADSGEIVGGVVRRRQWIALQQAGGHVVEGICGNHIAGISAMIGWAKNLAHSRVDDVAVAISDADRIRCDSRCYRTVRLQIQ